MSEILGLFLTIGLYEATLRIGTVYLLGTLGELVCERAGVMNLGIEGIMVLGAMVAFQTVFFGGPLWLGLVAGVLAGGVSGFVHALFSVRLGLNQHVVGIGLTLLCTGLALFVNRMLSLGADFTTQFPQIDPLRSVPIPVLADIPGLGPVLFDQPIVSYVALALIPVAGYALYRTPLGLALRTVGENPLSAETTGLDVHRIRTAALVVGSALMGLAGAYLSISYFNAFLPGIVSGRGWICVALVILANWRPAGVLGGALLFAGVDALAIRIQALGIDLPNQLFSMFPYLLTIVALVLVAQRATYPRALLVPYRRNERV